MRDVYSTVWQRKLLYVLSDIYVCFAIPSVEVAYTVQNTQNTDLDLMQPFRTLAYTLPPPRAHTQILTHTHTRTHSHTPSKIKKRS